MCRRVLLVVISMTISLSAAATDSHRPSPPFTGKSIPAPLRQKSQWRPPKTKLPAAFVSATRWLFTQGVADPRGCAYREIEVGTGSCWAGDAGVRKTHGWVLPARPGAGQRFAVCWNGLAYPVVSVGKRANLAKDMRALLSADRARLDKKLSEHRQREKAREAEAKREGKEYHPGSPFLRWNHATAEPAGVSHQVMLPFKAVLLLRLGHARLAERVWFQWHTGSEGKARKDPFLALATEWTWALFDRAVGAHMRGDDKLALLTARALVRAWPEVESEATRHGFELRPRSPNLPGEARHLPFLEPVHALLADQERRLLEERTSAPGEPQSTGRLIHDLQEVSARQWGQPGGVNLEEDRVVRALVKKGDEAVEPLLRCLETDTRLTRSVHFHRDFSRHRSLLGVHEAAYVSLASILETSFFGAVSTGDNLSSRGMEGRRKVAERIRAYWKKNRGLTLEERWYRTLADDEAGAGAWLRAAKDIVCPTNVSIGRGSMVFTTTTTVPPQPGQKPGLRGESLRARKDPGVTQLMIRRIAELSDRDVSAASGSPGRLSSACGLVDYLADWDIKAALPVLREQTRRCLAVLAGSEDKCDRGCRALARCVAGLAVRRARAKDPEALDDYAAWVVGANPRAVVEDASQVLEPLWRYPGDPAVARAAQRMFEDETSPWIPVLRAGKRGRGRNVDDLNRSPFLGLASFRRLIDRQLEDRTVAGHVQVLSPERIDIKLRHGWQTSASTYPGDPDCPEEGTGRDFRVCDLIAYELSRLDGTPRCELYWPEKKRDEAVAALRKLLAQYGARFRHREENDEGGSHFSPPDARLTFPSLDHPATQVDVAMGLAIFSLQGRGRVRLWKLPRRPMKAAWATRKDFRRDKRVRDPETGKTETRIHYIQGGQVWQAEELLVGGEWKRFYGMVGYHFVALVPAEEIELPAKGYGWTQLSGGLDCQLQPPGQSMQGGFTQFVKLGPTSPLEARVMLRNRRGLERTLPRQVSGVEVRLSRGTVKTVPWSKKHEEVTWEELKPKKAFHPPPLEADRTLAPAENFEAFRIDLKDLYGIEGPGKYRLTLEFMAGEGGLAEGTTNQVEFEVHAR